LHIGLLKKFVKNEAKKLYKDLGFLGRVKLSSWSDKFFFPYKLIHLNLVNCTGNYRWSPVLLDIDIEILGKVPNITYKFKFVVYRCKWQSTTRTLIGLIKDKFDFITSANSKIETKEQPPQSGVRAWR
jgi:hypothetical protein